MGGRKLVSHWVLADDQGCRGRIRKDELKQILAYVHVVEQEERSWSDQPSHVLLSPYHSTPPAHTTSYLYSQPHFKSCLNIKMCFLLMALVPSLPSSWYTFLDLSLIGHFHHSASVQMSLPDLPHPYPVPPYHVTLLLFIYSIIITRTSLHFPFACFLFVSSTRIYTP